MPLQTVNARDRESSFLPIFALSLVLGAVMLRTQRIFAAWAVHAAHNGLMVGMLVLASRVT